MKVSMQVYTLIAMLRETSEDLREVDASFDQLQTIRIDESEYQAKMRQDLKFELELLSSNAPNPVAFAELFKGKRFATIYSLIYDWACNPQGATFLAILPTCDGEMYSRFLYPVKSEVWFACVRFYAYISCTLHDYLCATYKGVQSDKLESLDKLLTLHWQTIVCPMTWIMRALIRDKDFAPIIAPILTCYLRYNPCNVSEDSLREQIREDIFAINSRINGINPNSVRICANTRSTLKLMQEWSSRSFDMRRTLDYYDDISRLSPRFLIGIANLMSSYLVNRLRFARDNYRNEVEIIVAIIIAIKKFLRVSPRQYPFAHYIARLIENHEFRAQANGIRKRHPSLYAAIQPLFNDP